MPDLRGMFLRGWDDGNIDPGRSIGGSQSDALGSHNHTIADNVGMAMGWAGGWGPVGGTHPVLRGDQWGGLTAFHTTYAGDIETRPKNISISYLIKSTKDGEERPLSELLQDFPKDYPGGVYDVLAELAAKLEIK